jgi:hypothetical protein
VTAITDPRFHSVFYDPRLRELTFTTRMDLIFWRRRPRPG